MMEYSLAPRARKQAWFFRFPRGLPVVLFTLVCLAIFAIVVAVEETDAAYRRVEVERNAAEISSALRQRAIENIAILRAAAAVFEAGQIASQADLVRVSEDLLPADEDHGALGLGWAARIAPSAISEFEAAMRARGMQSFKVFPRRVGETRPAVAVTYIAPLDRANLPALGFDMYSEPVRRQAMDDAARLRRPVATGKVRLIQDNGTNNTGFLVYMPVFDPARPGANGLRGFVYSPFRSAELLESAVRLTAARSVNIAVYDGPARPGNLLAQRLLDGQPGKSIAQPVQIGNRSWTVTVTEVKPARLTQLSQLVILAGSLFGILLLTISYLVIRRSAADRQALLWQSEQASIRATLSRELNHRVKNTLANVLSIAALTKRRTVDLDAFYESFTGRVQALSATHDLLTRTEWANTQIGDVVASELKPYMDRLLRGIHLSGPEIAIAPNDALSLGLAIHELATNAAKYGALSTDEGEVRVTWRKVSPELCEVDWRESRGPRVVEPTGRGFGRDLLERILEAELHSDVRLRFKPDGVECQLRVPIRQPAAFALRSGDSS